MSERMSAEKPSEAETKIKIQTETETKIKIQTETEGRIERQAETETERETRNERQSETETETRNERRSAAAVTAAVKPSILKPPMPRPSVATTSIRPVSLRSSTRNPLSVRPSIKRLSRATTSTGSPTIAIQSKERSSAGASSVRKTSFKKLLTDKALSPASATEKSPVSNTRGFSSITGGNDTERRTPKKVFHPFSCRLNTGDSNYWENLTQVVFAIWTLGILTVFRFSFFLLRFILSKVNVSSSEYEFVKHNVLIATCIWFATVAVVMFPLGLIPLLAASIKKRWVLVIHPWALMVMYFDFAVWLTVTTSLLFKLLEVSHLSKEALRQVQQTYFFFALIYIDIIVFFVLHYVYITYYIVAELTVIEEFY